MAKTFHSRHSLNIFSLTLEEWEYPIHKHNFFELIFVEKGKGTHILNGVKYPYQAGHVLLLTPEDEHCFEIEEKSIFGFLKFTEQLLTEKTENNSNSKWKQKIVNVLLNSNNASSDVISDDSDRRHLFQLLKILRVEYDKNDMYSRQATLELYGAMMVIISRNINKKNKTLPKLQTKEEEKISNILAYIRKHILDKEKIRLEAIANEFYMSPNYVSIFLKKHTGLSIQKFVLETKIKTAERLLKQSDLTISEIASRLEFTDASHFNKTFKKHHHQSPSLFRT